jgi:DNA-binding transcriptional MerR regulator
MNGKANDAFKTISEVSALLDVPQHVLRFWESKFSSLRPLKRSGGRRYYRPDDVAVLHRIRQLLYIDGFTIKGAQKLVRSKASATKANALTTASSSSGEDLAAAMAMLNDVKSGLAALKQQLNH